MASAPTNGTGFRALKGVAIFAASGPDGHREGGRAYGEDDLDAIVENFRRWSAPGARKPGQPFLRVVGTRGHADGKPDVFSDDPGAPAEGVITRVWRKGKTLLADVDGIPPETARLIDAGGYHAPSAEIYDAPPHGMAGRGAMLRRVAWLGGEPPALKTLPHLPRTQPGTPARFSETGRFDSRRGGRFSCVRAVRLADGLFRTFSEVVPTMSRDELLEALAQRGMDVSMLTEAVPDEALAEMLRVVDGQADGGMDAAGAPEGGDAADPMAPAPGGEMLPGMDGAGGEPPAPMPGEEDKVEDFAEPTDADDAIGKYTMHLGLSKKHAEYAERCKKYAEDNGGSVNAAPMGDATSLLTQGYGKAKKDDDKPAMFSEAGVRAMIASAVKAALAGENAQLHKFREESLKTERTKAVDAIIARLDLAGKLPPSERADARALMLLHAADPTVHRFSEGGRTVQATALDRYVATIERRPSLFSEAIPGAGQVEPRGDAAELAQVEGHYEAHAETFRKWGTGKDDFVDTFKTRKQRDPSYTAAQYLGKK